MPDIRRVGEEKRRSRRLPVEVKVDYRTVGRFLTDYTMNLSKGGLFVQTCLPLQPGERVRLRITLPEVDAPFALDGLVRWVAHRDDDLGHPPGMGIEFVDASDDLLRHVERLLVPPNP